MGNRVKTKKEFANALFGLLENKNYRDITINEICAVANKTKMTFYKYYKGKEALLAEASIDLINTEYNEDYAKILKKEKDIEEIEYQSLVTTYNWVGKHYNQIANLTYKGETLPLEIFKTALFNNYKAYMSEIVNSGDYDIPSDYIAIFFFEGLYNSCIYYAEQLKTNRSKKKVKEDIKKICRLLAKISMSMTKVM